MCRYRVLIFLIIPFCTATPLTANSGSDQGWFGSWTLYVENDVLFGTDQNYTQGLRATVLSSNLQSLDGSGDLISDYLSKKTAAFAGFLGKVEAYRRGVSFGQNIYTPTDIHTEEFLPNQRPYTAWLYLSYSFHLMSGGTNTSAPFATVIEFTTGVIGPWALGRFIQNGWHDLWNIKRAMGWSHQLRNEIGLNIVAERRHRYSTDGAKEIEGLPRAGWAADFIPHYGYSLGTISTYANLGGELRAGWHMPLDFGTSVIRATGDTASEGNGHNLGFHFFGGCDGRVVARDAFLDGNITRGGPHVPKRPVVADWQGGVAITIYRFKITYSDALRTKEFYGQAKRQAFSSLSITYSRPFDAKNH